MHELAAQLKAKELKKHLGKTYPVLWEQQINRDACQWTGYTPHYHKIVSNNSRIEAAQIRDVTVDQVSAEESMLVNHAGNREVRTNFSLAH